MLGYRVPAPDEAMLISGGKIRGGTPFRVVTGHGAVVMPFFRKVRFLTLAMCEAEVEETCVTHQGISLNVRAVIAFKVGNAPIQRQAQIAQAQANQAAAEAEQISQRNQAEYARQTAVVQAQYRAEVDTAQAEAAQAGPLAKAQAQRSVIAAQTELAQREAELRQQQLGAEVVKPAEAEAERVRILAVADAEKMKIQAESAASHNRVALDRMLIDQLPEIVKQAASGLAGANVTAVSYTHL